VKDLFETPDEEAEPDPKEAAERLLRERISALCKRLDVKPAWEAHGSDLLMWAAIGLKLALSEPEFHSLASKRNRGRPKGSKKGADKDNRIIIATETAATKLQMPFDQVLPRMIATLIEDGELPDQERTTHPKRLRRRKKEKDAERRENLAAALLSWEACWDKK
jgi:hypothetical protein